MRAAVADVVMAINERRRSRHLGMACVALPQCACAPQVRYQGPMLLLSTIVITSFKATEIGEDIEMNAIYWVSQMGIERTSHKCIMSSSGSCQ
jgi:hypothetical protein